MARVTVEDCLEKVTNRFELVAIASQRAKDLSSGIPTDLEIDNDKNAVIALREIASDKLDIEVLKEQIISSMQTRSKVDKIDEENLHAEVQDASSEDSFAAEEEDIFESSEHFDIESDQLFDDNIDEEEEPKM